MVYTKGQLISKWFFGVVDFLQKTNENKSTWGIIVLKSKLFFQADVSSQKMNEQIWLYYYDTSGRLIFVRFLENIEDTKKTFWN